MTSYLREIWLARSIWQLPVHPSREISSDLVWYLTRPFDLAPLRIRIQIDRLIDSSRRDADDAKNTINDNIKWRKLNIS